MSYNPHIHHRRSIRLKGYDYSSAGLYFITICVKDRACLFGEIVRAPLLVAQKTDAQKTDTPTMILNDAGKMVESEWLKLPERFKNIELHEYVVMPNHFHAILEIVTKIDDATVGATLVVAQNETVVDAVAQNNVADNAVAQNDDPDNQQSDISCNQQKGQPQGIAPTATATTTATTTKNIVIGKTVGDMVGAFQSIVTVNYIRGVKTLGWKPFNGKLWQRNYWEHIIRDEQSYQRISNYIINNPAKWSDDKFYTK
jgi:REP element-mobilizing transposase RayT